MLLQSRVTLLATALALAVPSLATVPADGLTPHDVAKIRQVGSAVISPDGATAAITLSVPREPGVDKDGGSWTELHVVDLDSGQQRPFVTGKSSLSSISWTPDGTGIAFLTKRGDDEHTCLYIIPIDGGEARCRVALEASIRRYDFAPDGVRVACIASAPEDKDRKKLVDKGFKQEIYEEDWKSSQLWITSLAEDAPEPRRIELEGHPSAVHWSPVDDRLLVVAAPTPLVDDGYMLKRPLVLNAESGLVLARFENSGKLDTVGWSPDGSLVTMIAAEDVNDPNAGRLLVAPSGGGELVDAMPMPEGDAVDFAWANAEALLAVAHHGVWSSLEAIAFQDGQPHARNAIVLTGGPVFTSFDLSTDGRSAVFVASAPDHPRELFALRGGATTPRRITDSNPWLADVRLGTQELVRFQARDGRELEGLLMRPLDEEAGQRYPLILSVHGGPEAHHSNGWLTRYGSPGQVAAARGFAVFYTNYRGSTGRGVAFSKLGQADPGGKEFDDLVDAVDHLIEMGLVDGERVGITGGSYGGYATAWCTTHYSERFAAGVMFVGISDKVSKVGTTDIPNEEYYVHALQHPWENWQFMLERSPIYHAGNCETPLLILHGKDDPRVNVGQSRELYRHLKLRSQAPVRLVLYPGEGHGNRKAAARLDYNLRMMRWFEHYLQGEGGEMPDYDIDYGLSKGGEDEPGGADD